MLQASRPGLDPWLDVGSHEAGERKPTCRVVQVINGVYTAIAGESKEEIECALRFGELACGPGRYGGLTGAVMHSAAKRPKERRTFFPGDCPGFWYGRNSDMITTIYQSPIGPLYIAETDSAISHLVFKPLEGEPGDTALLRDAIRQLKAYFAGELQTFDLPLAPKGTEFQMRAWRALQTIPYGVTWSYKQLAEAIDSPRGYRAVGLANNRNPISIFIPCHRVVGSGGALTGYGGGLGNKEYLLQLEGVLL